MEEEKKNYFEVEREYIYGQMRRYAVYSDGSQAHDSYDVDVDNNSFKEITTGFVVHEYDKAGMTIGYEFYPVETNMETMENNEEKVLERIKAEYDPVYWQNNEW